MRECRDRHLFDAWIAQGAGAEVEAPLRQHLEVCAACSDEVAATLELREALGALPVRKIASPRLEAVRFAVVAAARRSAAHRTGAVQRSPRRMAWWHLACAAVAAAALWVVAVQRGRWQPVATAELVEDAVGAFEPGGSKRGRYELGSGTARFSVRALEPEETFAVSAPGGDLLEARAGRFEVTVGARQIVAVRVTEGTARLVLREGSSRDLVAGEIWELPTPVATAPPPAAEASARVAEVETPSAGREASAAPPVSPPATASSHLPPVARKAATPEPPAPDATAEFDARFRDARAVLHAGRSADAASALDALASDGRVDAGRRGDALYWAAYAHAQAGHAAEAEARARRASAESSGWHVEEAGLLLGEQLLEKGDFAGARTWLEKAAASKRPSVRARARAALARMAAAPGGTR